MRSNSVPVRLDIPPHSARLVSWGRAPDGQWWALVSWMEGVVDPSGNDRHYLQMTAWTEARHVTAERSARADVPRVELGVDRARWAGPSGRIGYWNDRGWHVGIIDGHDPLPSPVRRFGN